MSLGIDELSLRVSSCRSASIDRFMISSVDGCSRVQHQSFTLTNDEMLIGPDVSKIVLTHKKFYQQMHFEISSANCRPFRSSLTKMPTFCSNFKMNFQNRKYLWFNSQCSLLPWVQLTISVHIMGWCRRDNMPLHDPMMTQYTDIW